MENFINSIIDGIKNIIKEVRKVPILGLLLAFILGVILWIANRIGRCVERKKSQKKLAYAKEAIVKLNKRIDDNS